MNFTVFFSNVRLYLRDCAQKKVSLKIHLIVNRLECVYISSKNTFNTIWSENINLNDTGIIILKSSWGESSKKHYGE